MASATFFSELLLIILAKHLIRYVFTTCSVFFSTMTLYGMLKNYVARGEKTLACFTRKRLLYVHKINGVGQSVWHAPNQGEVVRFVFSVLSLVAIWTDFIRVALGESVVQVFTAFPAAFAMVVFITALIDLLSCRSCFNLSQTHSCN